MSALSTPAPTAASKGRRRANMCAYKASNARFLNLGETFALEELLPRAARRALKCCLNNDDKAGVIKILIGAGLFANSGKDGVRTADSVAVELLDKNRGDMTKCRFLFWNQVDVSERQLNAAKSKVVSFRQREATILRRVTYQKIIDANKQLKIANQELKRVGSVVADTNDKVTNIETAVGDLKEQGELERDKCKLERDNSELERDNSELERDKSELEHKLRTAKKKNKVMADWMMANMVVDSPVKGEEGAGSSCVVA